jgi:alpha-beta hydrolase superfamily lysophospholipase
VRIGSLVGDYPNAFRLRAAGLRRGGIPADYTSGRLRPVVLLPGIYETWHFLRPIADALHADGHPVHVVETIGRNGRPIPWVATQARRLIDERELRHVVIVAHSKGGIVGKQLLVDEETAAASGTSRRIDRLVAIASPFAGSSMARIVPLGGLRAFLPGDALLGRLAAEGAVDARITSIAPRVDPHIPEGSRLDGAENIEIDVVGHFRILRDPRTIAAVREVVGSA